MSTGAERLESFLRTATLFRLFAELTRWLLRAAGLWLLLLIFVVLFDAATGMGRLGLLTLNALLITLAGGALVAAGGLIWRLRYRRRAAALLAEQQLGISDSRLINAVDLAEQKAAGSESLRAYAVRLGNELVATLSPGEVVERDRVLQGLKLAGIGAVALVIAYFLMPGVFHAVLPRLLAPSADHPPYTLVNFDVQVTPDQANYGGQAQIDVVLTMKAAGTAPPDKATVVFVGEEQGQESEGKAAESQPTRLPMLRVPLPAEYIKDESAEQATLANAPTTTTFEPPSALAYRLRIDQVRQSRTFYIDTPEGRSKRFTLPVSMEPLFEAVDVDYNYPTYTRWEPMGVPLGPEGVRAIEGTTVTLTVESNVPLKMGELLVTPEATDSGDTEEDGEAARLAPISVAMSPLADRPNVVQGSFDLRFNGEFELNLTGEDGTPSEETLRGKVICLKDKPPAISIDDPEPRIVAPEGWELAVALSAHDDVGIDRVELTHRVNDSEHEKTTLRPNDVDKRNAPSFNATHTLDLSKLDAKPGDVVRFFATGYDNSPNEQSDETEVFAVQVISMEEYEQIMRQNYHIEDLLEEWAEFEQQIDELREKREQLLEEMKELQKQIEEQGGQPTPKQQAKMQELEKNLDEYANEALDLFEKLRDRTDKSSLYEFEKPYKDMLRRIQQELQPQATNAMDVQRAMENMRQNPSAQARKKLQEAMDRFEQQNRPFTEQEQQEQQQTEEDLEKLQMAGEMMAQTQRIAELIEQQRDIAERMEALPEDASQTQADKQRAQQLAGEQRAVREQLTDAMNELRILASEAGGQLPKMSGSALDIADAIDQSGAGADQRQAEQAAGQYAGKQAAAAAASAADKLEALLGQCQGMGQSASSDLDGALQLSAMSMQQALQQMMQARMSQMGMGQQQGGQGTGFSGQFAQAGIVGPNMPQQGETQMDRPRRGRDGGQGRSVSGSEDAGEAPESITPEDTITRGGGVAAMPDVPVTYRELAEAYFRRLAEESADSGE